MHRTWICTTTLLVLVAHSSVTTSAELIPLHILYLSRDSDAGRAESFKSFLEDSFTRVTVIKRDEHRNIDSLGADVVLLDWSQSEARSQEHYQSPLGERTAWSTPTVLLGSAGHLLAGPWEVIGGAGCTCLQPFAYDLRDHAVALGPRKIDRSQQIAVTNPWPWESDEGTVNVLPLVKAAPGEKNGWCTYTYEHAQAPELEIICGGINAKTSKASGIWRQGNLLHFGFEEAPDELNANGEGLLVNAICYISRFTEDRPIIRTPSPFYSKVRIVDRDLIARALSKKESQRNDYLRYIMDKEAFAEIEHLDHDGVEAWFNKARPYISSNGEGKLTVDQCAQDLGIAPFAISFFDEAVSGLANDEDRAQKIRDLLKRYAPDGPDARSATADQWRRWLSENRNYLFFSDSGGFRWYIDPLAKKRQVPSRDLHGAARASRAG